MDWGSFFLGVAAVLVLQFLVVAFLVATAPDYSEARRWEE